jgi:hypothetical protein
MSALTFITSANIVNYNNVEEIQTIIVKTLARWIYVIPKEMYNGDYLRHWTQIEGANAYKLIFDFLEFNLHFVIGLSEFHLEMYAIGNYRRHGSSCDYFERIFDCLFIQLKHPDREFKKMDECLALAYTPIETNLLNTPPIQSIFTSPLPTVGALAETVIYSEDESESELDEESEDESEEEDSDDEDVLLRDMTDKQIDRYIYILGREPREEVDEWTRDFNGGAILRYSYVNFADTTVADRCVFNLTIRCARFAGSTLRNLIFEQVHFHECDFKSVIIENVTFKDCQFTECELDISISLDNSCSVENYDYEEELRQEMLEDNVTYRYC